MILPLKRQFILASQSPRRSELLSAAGYVFSVLPPDENAECGICSRETPPETVVRLAFQKARNVAEKLHRGEIPTPVATNASEASTSEVTKATSQIIVACDTVAECHGQILGKPVDREHAESMLKLMRGREHNVYSGLCLWDRETGGRLARPCVSKLRMDAISDEQLQAYLDTDLWEGKSGAFGFQDGPDWIHLLHGSASNVVGLPMELLAEMLGVFETLADQWEPIGCFDPEQ